MSGLQVAKNRMIYKRPTSNKFIRKEVVIRHATPQCNGQEKERNKKSRLCLHCNKFVYRKNIECRTRLLDILNAN